MRVLVTILAALSLTGCTWTRVSVSTVVVKTGVSVDKENSPDIKNELESIPHILRAVPEAEEGAAAYLKGQGSDK